MRFHFFTFGSGMNEVKSIVHNESELSRIATDLLQYTGKIKVFAFFGEMGSGKTTFIKSICQQLGVKSPMSSPTFSLVNEYITAEGKPVYHFDFYRVKSENEAIEIGVEEYFYSGYYCFAEWPEKILNLLPKDFVRVNIEIENELRIITFSL
jgi:tRNA threonylcarbamoyladenosine biosynthesis protein TsaE